ncbi:SGNH hydrolase [Neoconidiobolus thromboides FSU 785]|nr:SGNH hydrolase [Neoconidiobolus thromboides FSU 785]
MKILCFGDSITKGYASEFSTYFEDNTIYNGGENGGLVTEMENRLTNLLLKNQYDIIILLGGVNDLGSDIEINKIVHGFKKVYQIINNNKCVKKLIHLTIPFNAFDKFESEKKNKMELNDSIEKQLHSDKRIIFDLNNTEFNYLNLNDIERKLYWDDSIHYSSLDYKLLAKNIFTFYTNLLS